MRTLIAALSISAVFGAWASEISDTAKPQSLECKAGPLLNTYGETEWLVYACNDSRSVIFVTADGSPAMPFVFMVYVNKDGERKMHGEGTGDKKYTALAFEEIKTLSASDISSLVTQANEMVK
ncbi:hypothetical protein [Porticoccus sp.]